MKNIIFEVFVCMLLIGTYYVVTPDTVRASQDGDYTYAESGGVATIIGYTGAGGAIIIPSTLGGYPTATIGYAAFNSVKGHLITSVIIPYSVTSIKDLAFYLCTLLESVTIGSGVTDIGQFVFQNCSNLISITLLMHDTPNVCDCWVNNTSDALRGHTYTDSHFPPPGTEWADGKLMMGAYLPKNDPPVFGMPSPTNGSAGNPLSLSWSIPISDPDGDAFSWTIQSSNGQVIRASNDINETKSLSLTGLNYSTMYTIWVNATDPTGRGLYTRKWYTFATNSSGDEGGDGTPNSSPTANYSYFPSTPTVDDSIQFSDTSSDSDGSIASWSWDFGDGTKSTTKNPQHKYSANGVYTVTLEVTDDDGAIKSTSKTIIVIINNPPNPPLKPIGQTSIERGFNYTFSSSAIDPNGDQVRLRYDWGDGSLSNWSEFVDSNTTISFSHAWVYPSNYSIHVIAQDKNGLNSSWSIPLTITVSELNDNIPPIIEIKVVDNVSVNQTIIFDASSSIDPDGEIISYNWNFGDGTSSTAKTSTHKYTNPDIYLVSLQVTDGDGATSTKTLSVTVGATAVTVIEPKTPGFELIIIIGAIALILISKRKSKK